MSADPTLWEKHDHGIVDAGARDQAADRPADGPAADRLDANVPDQVTADALATYLRTWVKVSVPSSPAAILGAKLIYQSTTGKVLLYGGTDLYTVSAASWLYDGTDWQKICDPCPPGPRFGHGLVFDEKRGVAVLFGGGSTLEADVWELASGTWTRVWPGGQPPAARRSVLMAFDKARGRTVLFGGLDENNNPLANVHEYDGSSWYGPFAPTPGPAARSTEGSSATFADGNALSPSMRNRVIIYGGDTSTEYLDDCWAWDGTQWTSACTTCTGKPRTAAGFAYDPATGRALVINGWSSGEIEGTYEFLGQFWAQTSSQPGARDTVGVTFDTKRNRVVVYGGNGPSCGGNCDETLEYVAP